MLRKIIQPRENWSTKVRDSGLLYIYTPEGLYWNESAYYELSQNEFDLLSRVTTELHNMCIAAVQHVIEHNRFEELGISPEVAKMIVESWEKGEKGVYGRFDLAFTGGDSKPKLLEYNADTPTSLLESAEITRNWREEVFPEAVRENTIQEQLISRWEELLSKSKEKKLFLATVNSVEDVMNVAYLEACAQAAGATTQFIEMRKIEWNKEKQRFEYEGEEIKKIFKLYPWEDMLREKFAPHIISSWGSVQWIEPIWKMILSNKGILPILWELNPGHPNLLECYMNSPHGMSDYVSKPTLSREGQNVEIYLNGTRVHSTDGSYGSEKRVFQKYAQILDSDGKHAVIGSWVIGNTSAGIGIRESQSTITDNYSQFIPHVVVK